MGKEVPHEYVEVLGWIIDLGIASIVILVALPLTEYSAIIGLVLVNHHWQNRIFCQFWCN